MAQRDDGGEFTPDLYSRLMTVKNGSAPLQALNDSDNQSQQNQQNAQQIAMGTLGMGSPQNAALKALATGGGEEAGLSLADRIRQAAQNSAIKQVPSAADQEAARFVEQAAGKPSFFDAAKQKATELGVGASPMEQQAMAKQAADTQARLAARNQTQIAQKYQNLQNMLKKGSQ